MAVVLRGGDRARQAQSFLGEATADMPAWMAASGGIIKGEKHSLVALAEVDTEQCCLKYYRHKSPLHALLLMFNRHRGVQAFDNALELADKGFKVPQPRACLGVPGGLLLITQGLIGSDFRALWQENPAILAEQGLLARCGELLAGFHKAGYSHGDCKWSNLFWSDGQIYLLDLEAVQRAAPGSSRQARDLARFTVNAEDFGLDSDSYGAFLEAYCQGRAISEATLIDQLLPRLRKLRARHSRKYGERGAPLL